MKSIKSLLVAILVMVSSIAFADQSGCEESYGSADAVYVCKKQWVENTLVHSS